jgi:type IV pilus assembly protein PilA
MTKAIRKRLAGDEGFTLIELMVVVMIIAILIAIAIPSFLGFRKSAQDRAAQADIRSVLLAEKAIWLDEGDYTAVVADLTAFEPNLVFYDAVAAPQGVQVTLNAVSDDIVCIQRTSASGTTYLVWESSLEGTRYGDNAALGFLGACPAVADAAWGPSGW